eukprot:151345_1
MESVVEHDSNSVTKKERNAMFSISNEKELSEMKQMIDSPINDIHEKQIIDKNDSSLNFRLNWLHIIECIRHEMWPKLASSIYAIIDNKDEAKHKIIDLYNLDGDTISDVIEILKSKRHLAIEERDYLRNLIKRAKQFNPISCDNTVSTKNINTGPVQKQIDFESKNVGLNLPLLIDIFSVHRSFMFNNFHFNEYSVNNFKNDIKKNAKEYVEETIIDQYCRDITLTIPFGLYPNYLVNDDLFKFLDYVFAISYYANYLKQNPNINQFELRSFIIPSAISCIYDENILFNYCGRAKRVRYFARKLLSA